MPDPSVWVDTDKIDASVPRVEELGGRVTGIFSGLIAQVGAVGPAFSNADDPTARVFEEGFWPNAHAVFDGVRVTGDGLHEVAGSLRTYSGIFKTTEAGNVDRSEGFR